MSNCNISRHVAVATVIGEWGEGDGGTMQILDHTEKVLSLIVFLCNCIVYCQEDLCQCNYGLTLEKAVSDGENDSM